MRTKRSDAIVPVFLGRERSRFRIGSASVFDAIAGGLHRLEVKLRRGLTTGRVSSVDDSAPLWREAHAYCHANYDRYEFINEYAGFFLSRQPNDISRHLSALEYFLDQVTLKGRPIESFERIRILRRIHAEASSDRVAVVALAKLLLEKGSLWEAFDAAIVAIGCDATCEMSMAILLRTLQALPRFGHWAGFFRRDDVPSVAALQREAPSVPFNFVADFVQAVLACDSPKAAASSQAIHSFYHRWGRVYRRDDVRIGTYRACSTRDQSQHIAALRHAVEFASHRRMAHSGVDDERETPKWLDICTEIVVPLADALVNIPPRLLAAEYLARNGRLDEADYYVQRAGDIDTICLFTDHVRDCIARARERYARGEAAIDVSFVQEPPARFAGRFCHMPFGNAFINPDGDTFLCCPSLLPVSIGNVFRERDWDAIWNSSVAREIRSTVHDGTFKYCSKRNCHLIVSGTLPAGNEQNERWQKFILDQEVYVTDTLFADLGYDASCNLTCQQCRIGLIVLDRKSVARLDTMREAVIDDLLSRVHIVRITSGGEALFSRHFRKLLGEINEVSCPKLTHLELLTNGMLFNPRQWAEFSNLHYLNILVAFSIDAGSKQTFETIRRNGKWETICKNLKFASSLRRERRIKRLHLVYAVQAANYRELPDLVRIAEELGVDALTLFKLENSGSYSDEDYRSRNVVDPSHPLHQDFLRVMQDPMLGLPLVDRSNNLGPFVAAFHGPPAARTVVAVDPYFGEIYDPSGRPAS